MSRHIQNEDVKSLADLGGDKSKLPSSDKIGMQKLGKDVTLGQAIDDRLLHGQPLLIHQDYPATGFLRIEPSEIASMESIKSVVPIKSQIQNIPASSINFQTGATSGATFDLIFPNGVIGEFTRLGLTLLSNGVIKGIFAPNAASLGALANPGTLFVKGGLPLGYINLQYTSAIPGRFKTPGSIANIVEAQTTSGFQIFIFGSGAGGGSGEGDANSLLEDLKDFLRSSTYQWVTPNIFSVNESNLIDSGLTDGTYDITSSSYILDSGQYLVSSQLFGARFLNSLAECPESEVHVKYDVNNIDPTPDIYISRNGGNEWQQANVDRVGESDKFRASVLYFRETITENISEASMFDNDSAVELNATANKIIAQKFTLTAKSSIRKLNIELEKIGSPTGNLILKIVKDSAGEPSLLPEDLVLEKPFISVSNLPSGLAIFELDEFNKTVLQGDYWLLVESDDLYKTNNFMTDVIRVRTDGSSPSVPDMSVYDSSWTTLSGSAVGYIINGIVFDLRVRIMSNTSGSRILGFGVFYGRESISETTVSVPNIHREIFSGDSNTYEFTLPFLPDIDLLRVYDVKSGQVYVYPSFDVSGNKVSFLTGTFLSPGENIFLLFDQSLGGSFDNSDKNRLLMAENGLGSLDGNLDASSPGVGLKLRSPDGQLWHITVTNSGAIQTQAL